MAIGADDELFLDSDCSTHESGCESNHPDLRLSKSMWIANIRLPGLTSTPWIVATREKPFCKVCIVDFSVAGGSVHQIKRRCLTQISNANRVRNCSHHCCLGGQNMLLCAV